MTWASAVVQVVTVSGPSLVILAAGRARRYGGLKQLAPIGLHGEGVIDLLASDAYAAGFDEIVIVVNPDTGPEIEAHVARALARGIARSPSRSRTACAAPSTPCSPPRRAST